jgi:DNA polymerase III beta subunit
MKIKFHKATELAFLLSHSVSICKRSAKEWTEMVLIKVEHNKVSFIGCNENSSFTRDVPSSFVEVIENGTIAVSAQRLIGCIRTYGEKAVTLSLSTKENKLFVQSGRSRLRLDFTDGDSFPDQSRMDMSETVIQFDLEVLKQGLSIVRQTMPSDHAMAALNGIHVKVDSEKNIATLISTDSYRLNVIKVCLPEQTLNQDIAFTIPASAVARLTSMVAESTQGTITLFGEGSSMSLSVSTLTYRTALIDASYPDINQILPKESLGYVVVNRKELISLLDRTAVAMSAEKIPRLELNFKPQATEIAFEGGKSIEEDFDVSLNTIATECSTAVNYRFLKDIVQSINDEEIVATVCPVDQKGNILHYLVCTPKTNKHFAQFSMLVPMR